MGGLVLEGAGKPASQAGWGLGAGVVLLDLLSGGCRAHQPSEGLRR